MNRILAMKFNQGFTLIELMIIVTVIAIMASIALPSYQAYTRKANAAYAQQEILKLSDQLERHKSRNFSYKNFTPSTITLDRGEYILTITDDTTASNPLSSAATNGHSWVIKATTPNARNMKLIAKSSGLRCQSITSTAVDNDCSGSICTTCETDSEAW